MKRSKVKAPNVSPNSPELLLVADLAGVAPKRLAGAFRDPTHLSSHITAEEVARVLAVHTRLREQGGASPRLVTLLDQINVSLYLGLADAQEKKLEGPHSNA